MYRSNTVHQAILGALTVLVLASLVIAYEAPLEYDWSITEATSWTASPDTVGSWYGADFSGEEGYARLDFSHVKWKDISKSRRSILIALTMPEAGDYTFDVDVRFNDYHHQFSYWQVYAVKEGADLPMTGGPVWKKNYKDTKRLFGNFAPDKKDDGTWYSYNDTFKLNNGMAKNYDYLAFVMTGSKHPDEVMDYANFATNVPGFTAAMIGGTGGGVAAPEPTMIVVGLVTLALTFGSRRHHT
jgi:hypothetical protein